MRTIRQSSIESFFFALRKHRLVLSIRFSDCCWLAIKTRSKQHAFAVASRMGASRMGASRMERQFLAPEQAGPRQNVKTRMKETDACRGWDRLCLSIFQSRTPARADHRISTISKDRSRFRQPDSTIRGVIAFLQRDIRGVCCRGPRSLPIRVLKKWILGDSFLLEFPNSSHVQVNVAVSYPVRLHLRWPRPTDVPRTAKLALE